MTSYKHKVTGLLLVSFFTLFSFVSLVALKNSQFVFAKDGEDSEDSEDSEDNKTEENKKDEEKKKEDDKKKEENSSKSGTSNKVKIEIKSEDDENEDENENDESLEVDDDSVKSSTGDVETSKIKKMNFKLAKNGKAEVEIEEEGKENKKETDEGELLSVDNEKAKLKIKVEGNRLKIESEGEFATTKFPLSFDPETNLLTVTTPSRNVTIKVLPEKAIANFLRNGKASVITSREIEKSDDGKVVYHFKAKAERKLGGFFKFEYETEGDVDAETGEVTGETQPWFLKLFGFAFTK